MAKAILLVRVSTDAQSFDEQEKQLYEMAIKDGYSDSDIIPIAEKESGSKLTEEQRKGLNRLKEVIATEDVAVVYAWEVSRIARKKKILFNIVELLVSKKIQLIISEPSLKLLNEDGTVNDAAETIFTLFAQLAESEMRTKVARFKRTKRAMAEQGKWIGGHNPKYGYHVDDNGYYAPHPIESEIVKRIYQLYVNSDMGYIRLSQELKLYGINFTPRRLTTILTDKCYTGQTEEIVRPDGNRILKRTWPVIIDADTWAKAEKKRTTNTADANKSNNYLFGQRLIVCPDCGQHYVAYTSSGTYQCLGRKDKDSCNNNACILINALDSILWWDVQGDLLDTLVNDKAFKIAQYQQQIQDYRMKIAAAQKVIGKVNERLEKVGELYETGVYSREKMIDKRDTINADAKQAQQRIAQYESNIANLQSIMDNMEDAEKTIDKLNRIADGIASIEDYRVMYDIVHTYVKQVIITEHPIMGVKCTKRIEVTHVNGTVSNYYFMYHRKKGNRYWVEPSTNEAIQKKLREQGDFYFPLDDGTGDFKELVRIPRKKRYVRIADRQPMI